MVFVILTIISGGGIGTGGNIVVLLVMLDDYVWWCTCNVE